MGGKRKEIKTMSKIYLPEDVIFNVLARLPVRILLKLRCVSKSWAHLINSPEFIKSHLNLSLTDSYSQKFIFETRVATSAVGCKSRISFKLWPGNFNSLQNSQNFDSPAELYCPEPIYDQGKTLEGSSRGLVCIRYDDDVCLCNPWTRKYKILPRSPLEIFAEGIQWVNTNYGLGYDDIHDDYKVVRLSRVRSKTPQKFCKQVEIYSLKSNKWKSIETLPHAIVGGPSGGVLLNNTLHWILRCYKSEYILAIDLRTEECQFLLLPDDFEGFITSQHWTLGEHRTLGVSDATLHLSVPDSAGFVIWLMKDYGIKDSWTKLKVDILGLNSCTNNLIRYSESEKQLIFSSSCHSLYWYDIEKKILYKTENIFLGKFFYTVESLVPLCTVDWEVAGTSAGRSYSNDE